MMLGLLEWLIIVQGIVHVFLPDSSYLRFLDTHRGGIFTTTLYLGIGVGWAYFTQKLCSWVLSARLFRQELLMPWHNALTRTAYLCLLGNWTYSNTRPAVAGIVAQVRDEQQAQALRKQEEIASQEEARKHAAQRLETTVQRVCAHAIEHGFGATSALGFTVSVTQDASENERLISRITRAGELLRHARELATDQTGDDFIDRIEDLLVQQDDAGIDAVESYVAQMRHLRDLDPHALDRAAVESIFGDDGGQPDLQPVIRAVEAKTARERERALRRARLTALEARFFALRRPLQIGIEPLLSTARAAVDAQPRTFRKAFHALERALNAADSSHASFN